MEQKRPLGITLISLFLILIGIAAFLAALGMAFLATLSLEQFLEMMEEGVVRMAHRQLPNGLWCHRRHLPAAGSALLLLAYGFLKARPWAWTMGMVLALVSIIIAFIQPWAIGFNDPAWVSQLIWSLFWPWVIIIYLTRPKIKRYFGRATD